MSLDQMDDATKARFAQYAEGGSDEALRISIAQTSNDLVILALEWRSGRLDGEVFPAVFSPETWRTFVDSVNEADRQFA